MAALSSPQLHTLAQPSYFARFSLFFPMGVKGDLHFVNLFQHVRDPEEFLLQSLSCLSARPFVRTHSTAAEAQTGFSKYLILYAFQFLSKIRDHDGPSTVRP